MSTESKNPRGLPIRDIRDDLQQRIAMCEEAITSHERAFERQQAELQAAHKLRVENLKTALVNYRRLLTMEEVFQTPAAIPAVSTATETFTATATATAATTTAVAPKHPLADFLYEEIAQKGPKTKDELREIAYAAGYYPQGEGGRAIHATIVNLVRGGRAVERDGRYVAASIKQKELI